MCDLLDDLLRQTRVASDPENSSACQVHSNKDAAASPEGSLVQTLAQVLLAMLLDSQSRPSYRPSPEVAHVLWIYLHNLTSMPDQVVVRT